MVGRGRARPSGPPPSPPQPSAGAAPSQLTNRLFQNPFGTSTKQCKRPVPPTESFGIPSPAWHGKGNKMGAWRILGFDFGVNKHRLIDTPTFGRQTKHFQDSLFKRKVKCPRVAKELLSTGPLKILSGINRNVCLKIGLYVYYTLT